MEFQWLCKWTQGQTAPEKLGIAVEIALISVCVRKLLLLPVWVYLYFQFAPDAVF